MPVMVHADPLVEELWSLGGGLEKDGDGDEGERCHGP